MPIIETGLSRHDIESYLVGCGYWGTPEDRERYSFLLSPAAYALTPSERGDLARFAGATWNAAVSLQERLCDIAARQTGPATNGDGRLLRLANNATRGLYSPRDGERRIPPILKVDLMLCQDGRFQIAEVDAYNPRGLGYVALLQGSMPNGTPQYPGLDGVYAELSKGGNNLRIVVSEYERFYETAFKVLARALVARGMDVRVIRARDIASGDEHIEDGDRLLSIPDTLDAHASIRNDLLSRYRDGRIGAFFPPTSYLGSKAFLPELRNMPGMAEFMPETALVGKTYKDFEGFFTLDVPLVLKATVSSGLKGVLFSDLDPDAFGSTLSWVRQQMNASWILQAQVKQEAVPVPVFEEDGSITTQHHFFRITAYVTEGGIIYAEVTGRPDPKVHGAKDCIQIPTVFA